MTRTGYAQRRPYIVPGSLDELTGPTHGLFELPTHLAWTGRRTYDLDDPADRAVLYERVIVEATCEEDLRLLAAATVSALWHRLFLPTPVRALWEARFADLATAA